MTRPRFQPNTRACQRKIPHSSHMWVDTSSEVADWRCPGIERDPEHRVLLIGGPLDGRRVTTTAPAETVTLVGRLEDPQGRTLHTWDVVYVPATCPETGSPLGHMLHRP